LNFKKRIPDILPYLLREIPEILSRGADEIEPFEDLHVNLNIPYLV